MRLQVHIFFSLLFLFIGMNLLSCSNSKKENKIVIFGASSLHKILSEIAVEYEKTTQVKIVLNSASSGVLARQIQQGAKAHLYVSANKEWVTYLQEEGKLNGLSPQLLVSNELVLITPKNTPSTAYNLSTFIEGLTLRNNFKVAIGNPQYVPAGKYAQQALNFYGITDISTSQYVLTKDVRSALMTVELSEADFGIVYKTDALKSAKVNVLTSFPEESHSKIMYYIATCAQTDLAANFYTFLLSNKADSIWRKYGFTK